MVAGSQPPLLITHCSQAQRASLRSGSLLIFDDAFELEIVHPVGEPETDDEGDEAHEHVDGAGEFCRQDHDDGTDNEAEDELGDDGVVIFQQAVHDAREEQHGDDEADAEGNAHGHVKIADTGGHWLVEPHEEQERRGAEPGHDHGESPDEAAEHVPAKVWREATGAHAAFHDAEKHEGKGEADDEACPAFGWVAFGGVFEKIWHGAADQAAKKRHGDGGVGAEEDLDELCQQHKADEPSDDDGDEESALFFEGADGMLEEIHHWLVDAKSDAKHAAADAGQNGAGADDGALQHEDEPADFFDFFCDHSISFQSIR